MRAHVPEMAPDGATPIFCPFFSSLSMSDANVTPAFDRDGVVDFIHLDDGIHAKRFEHDAALRRKAAALLGGTAPARGNGDLCSRCRIS